MTATEIAIQWSAPEGAAEYELHRLPRDSDVMPGAEAMTEASFVESVEAVGAYEDPSVREGEQYWFGVRGLAADGTLLAHGWHAVDAVTDEQPPAVVGDLTAVVVDGEIVVTWTRPTDNYELASYLVSRAVEGEELESVGAAYNPDQTTFIDDPATLSGAVTYSIVALDVHWNKSDPATVVVNVS